MGRKLTIAELAGATGQKVGTVNKHFERKKFRKTQDGFINPDIDYNKAYINEVTKGAGLYGKVTVEKVTVIKPEKEKPEPTEKENVFQDLELRQKRSQVELVERNAELKLIELEKKAGNLLPVDKVEQILVVNLQSIIRNFEMEAENQAVIIVERFGGTREDIAEITKKLRVSLGKSIEKSKTDAGHEIDGAILEYQDIRSRGERK